MTTSTQHAPCPQCGEPVSLTLGTWETSDQIAADRTACPNCDAPLARAIAGHADGGWRLDEQAVADEANQPAVVTEQHRIVGPATGEPLSDRDVGVRVRIPLSGCPSQRWSRDLSARLTNELVGHPAVGHLRLNHIVQGDHIVLEGVEAREAPLLSNALARAVAATNAECATDPEPAANPAQPRADAIAGEIAVQ
jgi:hypothetical protein